VIQVGIITGDWLLDGHIEISTCTEPGCPDWHTLTIYRHDAEVLTVALSPDEDRELGKRLTGRANNVTTGPRREHRSEDHPTAAAAHPDGTSTASVVPAPGGVHATSSDKFPDSARLPILRETRPSPQFLMNMQVHAE
jgi:hypothetical protein